VAGVAILSLALGVAATCVAAAALVIHCALRVPRATRALVRYDDGSWALPEAGLDGLCLGSGTTCSTLWIRMVFRNEAANGRRRRVVLLLKDQLDAASWRALQAQIRRGDGHARALPEQPASRRRE
jgi:hypothetical protein